MHVDSSALTPGKLSVSEISDYITVQNEGLATADYLGLTVGSVFQPIVSLTHQRTVGYEALARSWCNQGNPVSPAELFSRPGNEWESVLLDRLCRYIHIKNFQHLAKNCWLFLNISPQVIALGGQFDAYFGQLIQTLQFPPHQIVAEIVEHSTLDVKLLEESVEYYRQLGCLTAIDDFGAGHSNFERIWTLRPDIVKLDRSMICRASQDKRAQSLLSGIVDLLHQASCLVLIEGVETEEQSLIAMDAGVDFIQGYFFAKPHKVTDTADLSTALLDMTQKHRSHVKMRTEGATDFQQHFAPLFQVSGEALAFGARFRQATRPVFQHHAIDSCYLLDEDGNLVEKLEKDRSGHPDKYAQFKPLTINEGSNWFHRHYFQRAVKTPGKLNVSRPYQCITGLKMCVTLSYGFEVNGSLKVLCADILS